MTRLDYKRNIIGQRIYSSQKIVASNLGLLTVKIFPWLVRAHYGDSSSILITRMPRRIFGCLWQPSLIIIFLLWVDVQKHHTLYNIQFCILGKFREKMVHVLKSWSMFVFMNPLSLFSCLREFLVTSLLFLWKISSNIYRCFLTVKIVFAVNKNK